MSLEETFSQISSIDKGTKDTRKSILLCDRGCMDGKAYMEDRVWNKMISTLDIEES
jgi:hypothetical protein